MSSCKYVEFGCEQATGPGGVTRYQQQQHFKTRTVSHVSLMKTPSGEQKVTRIICGDCAHAEAAQEGDVRDITEFLQEINREASVSVVDWCQRIAQESPLTGLFEKRKTQALATLAKLSQRIAAAATIIKGKELSEGCEKFLNESVVAQTIQQQEFLQQTILALERNQYKTKEQFMAMLREASDASSKNKEILISIEERQQQEDEIALKEMEIIQLKLASEAARVFTFFDANIQLHSQARQPSTEGKDISSNSGSGSSSSGENSNDGQERGFSGKEDNSITGIRHAKHRLMQIQSLNPLKSDGQQQQQSTTSTSQQLMTPSSIRVTRSQTVAATSTPGGTVTATTSVAGGLLLHSGQKKFSSSGAFATPLTETFQNGSEQQTTTSSFTMQSRSGQVSAIKPKALFSGHKQSSSSSHHFHQQDGGVLQPSMIYNKQQQMQLQQQQQQHQQQQQQQNSAKKISAAIFASIFPSSSSSSSASKVAFSPQQSAQTTASKSDQKLQLQNQNQQEGDSASKQESNVWVKPDLRGSNNSLQGSAVKVAQRIAEEQFFPAVSEDSAAAAASAAAEMQLYDDEDEEEEDKENLVRESGGYLYQFEASEGGAAGQTLSSMRSPGDKRKERRLRKREQKKLKKIKIQEEIQAEQDLKLVKLRQLDAERTRQRHLDHQLKHQQLLQQQQQQQQLILQQQQQQQLQLQLQQQQSQMDQTNRYGGIGAQSSDLPQDSKLSEKQASPKKQASSSGFRYSSIDTSARGSRILGLGSSNNINIAALQQKGSAVETSSSSSSSSLIVGGAASNFESLLHSFRSQTNHLAMVAQLRQAASVQQQKYNQSQQQQQQQQQLQQQQQQLAPPSQQQGTTTTTTTTTLLANNQHSLPSSSMKRSYTQSLASSALGHGGGVYSKGRLPSWNVGCFDGDISPSLSQEPAGSSGYKKQKTEPAVGVDNKQESQEQQVLPLPSSSHNRSSRFIDQQQSLQTQQSCGSIARENTVSVTARPGWKTSSSSGVSGAGAYSNPFLIHQSTTLIENDSSEKLEIARSNSQHASESLDFAKLLKEQLQKKIRDEVHNSDVYSSYSNTKRLQFQLVNDDDDDLDIRTNIGGGDDPKPTSHNQGDASPILYSPGVQFSPIESEEEEVIPDN